MAQGLPTPVLPLGDTNKIALVSGNDLYLMKPDGSELTLVRTENSPKSNLHWIAGGRLIYMSRNCAFMLDAQTNRVQQLTCFTPSESLEGFRVSPDGKYVAISVQRTLNILPFDTAVLRDVNTRFNLITLKQNCFYNQYPFRDVRWSKDNTQLAAQVIDTQLVNSDQVFLVKVDIPTCATTGLVRMDRIPGSHIEYDGESTRRIASYDWDGDHRFLLNDSIRNEGFGNLYLYDSNTKEATRLNPIDGECCYRDARWSPDGKYIFFAYQKSGDTGIELYYMPVDGSEDGQPLSAIELPAGFFSTPREKPQPALQPAQ